MMSSSSCTFATAVLVLLVGSTLSEKSDASCDSSQAPASLLQKDVRRHTKSVISHQQQQQQQPGFSPSSTYHFAKVLECNGTIAQERCWFLSEMGDNCDDTCALYGLGFDYVVADPKHPLMPHLVGHKPSTKQDAWAAFECYHPQEDRYHTANANSGKHMMDDVAHWSHEGCKLACPCSFADVAGQNDTEDVTDQETTLSPLGPAEADQVPAPAAQEDSAPLEGSTSNPVISESNEAQSQCSWKQPPACAPEFKWKGVMYTGCATVDSQHDKPWCKHHTQHSEGETETSQAQVPDWSYCNYECDAPAPAPVSQEGCGWSPAPSCVNEFDYEGTHYTGCTLTDHKTPWCSNSNPYQGSWNQCTYSCAAPQPLPEEQIAAQPIPEEEEELHPPKEEEEEEMQCTWEPKQECYLGGFEYKGVAYTGCANIDHPTPWCSHDKVHQGSWTPCSRVCVALQTTLPPSPIPQTFAPTMAPPSTIAPTMASPAPAPQTTQPTTHDENPCTRHPEAENDLIGASVTLDEAGYKIAASADSPINMKRFICRTVKELKCRVNDLSALMAFVPYYSGLVSDQSFTKLETELEMLCHVGGQWVEPRKSQ